MQTIHALAAAAALFTAGTAGSLITGLVAVDEQDPRDFASGAKITLREAIRVALDARPGRAVSAELEFDAEADEEDGDEDTDAEGEAEVAMVYEIDVVTDQGLYEVAVDAVSGKVLENEAEDEDDELAAHRRVLRHTELTLAQLVEAAEAVVKGQVVAAELEADDGQPICEILFVHTRYLIEVELEGRAGHLVGLELEGGLYDDGDEADEYEDGEDEDEGEDEGEEEEEAEEEEGAVHHEHGHGSHGHR